ncbi:kinase domain protein, partial [Ancylostoma duodenale]
MRQQFDRPLAQAERGRRKQQRAEDVRVSSQPASSSPPRRRGGRVLVAALICQLAVCVVPGRGDAGRSGAGRLAVSGDMSDVAEPHRCDESRLPCTEADALSTFSCTLLELDENKGLSPRLRKNGVKLPRLRKRASDFVFLRILGEGAYSTVYLARELQGGQTLAIKVVQKDFLIRHQKLAAIIREKHVLASLNYERGGHPFVSRLYCTFHDPERLYFVTDVAHYGELLVTLNRLGSFDIATSRFYAAEIVEALEFIHKYGVVHRDLKPENVLIRRNGHIMLTDFGSAQIYDESLFIDYEEENDSPTQLRKVRQVRKFAEVVASSSASSSIESDEQPGGFETTRRATFVGTAQYVSPEMLRGDDVGPPSVYTSYNSMESLKFLDTYGFIAAFRCDYWALGAMIFQMISGQAPFRAINDFHLMNKIQKLDFSFPAGFPDVAKDIVSKLLVLDPTARLGSSNLESLKTHEFFEGVDWKHIVDMKPPDILLPLPAGLEEAELNPESMPEPGLDEKALNRLMNLSLMEMGPSFVQDNLIIRSGFIDKKKGLFSRRRMFLLTEGPHLFYVDPNTMELKGEVPWSPCMRTEVKNFRSFFVHT